MALKEQDIYDKGWESIETENGNFIFTKYFLDWKSELEVRKEILERNKKKDYRKVKNSKFQDIVISNLIKKYTKAWEKLGYIQRRKLPKEKWIDSFHPSYECKVKPIFFFDWAQEFNDKEKRKISNLIENKQTREIILGYPEKTLFDKIKSFLYDYYINNYNSNLSIIESELSHPTIEESIRRAKKRKNLKKKKSILNSVREAYDGSAIDFIVSAPKQIASYYFLGGIEKEEQRRKQYMKKWKEDKQAEEKFKDKIKALFGFGGQIKKLQETKSKALIEKLKIEIKEFIGENKFKEINKKIEVLSQLQQIFELHKIRNVIVNVSSSQS